MVICHGPTGERSSRRLTGERRQIKFDVCPLIYRGGNKRRPGRAQLLEYWIKIKVILIQPQNLHAARRVGLVVERLGDAQNTRTVRGEPSIAA